MQTGNTIIGIAVEYEFLGGLAGGFVALVRRLSLDAGFGCSLKLETPNLETVFMRLVINGKEQSFGESLNLAQLVEQLGIKGDRVAVELNREIVRARNGLRRR